MRALAPANERDPEVIKKWKKEVLAKWRTMLADWGKVEQAATIEEKDAAWDAFRQKYSGEIAFVPIIDYIQAEWMDDTVKFLNCEANNYLHFDNRATSRNESAHWLLKRDLQASTHDLLSAILSTSIGQFEQKLADQRVNRPVHLMSFLYRDVVIRVSQFALEKVENINKRFLPIGAPKTSPIPPLCTGSTTRTIDVPCIHILKGTSIKIARYPLINFINNGAYTL